MPLSSFFPLFLLPFLAFAAEKPIPPVPDKQPEPPFAPVPRVEFKMLLPGFTVRELPVRLTSLNNIEYSADGRLFAGGYDGRFHVLRDLDGDGLEEHVDTFSPQESANYPLGMALKDGDLYAVLTDEVIRWRDTDGDGIPDQRTTVLKGFDDPALVAAPYLNHRRVDSSMAIAFGPDGAMYLTMGNAGYNNAYWQDKQGVAHYSTDRRRGCLLRIGADGRVEQLSSGLRYIMSLQFNRHGDLFGTDQEGATWVPNGNPFDELLHLQAGRHYGFPPRHPRWLPGVIDEPSVWDFEPQHQSTCGFRFNGPAAGRGRFGPESWAGSAFTVGESRGKLWRTSLAKTAAGYVAQTELIGTVPLLPVDCAISPAGDLVICCHTGKPDWGNGPKGEGRLFKISYRPPAEPRAVLTWPTSPTRTTVVFDRPVTPAPLAAKPTLEGGRYVQAADRFETVRPGYAVVKMQQAQPRTSVPVQAVSSGDQPEELVVVTASRTAATHYALSLPGQVESAYTLAGLAAEWTSPGAARWSGWLPHPDLVAAQEFTLGSPRHDALWRHLATDGQLTLTGQLDLAHMLIPATQPTSRLDYLPAEETVTLILRSDSALDVECPAAALTRVDAHETRLTLKGAVADQWAPLTLRVRTPCKRLDVSFVTTTDPRERALPSRRFLLPFARPAAPDILQQDIPQIAGGDWNAGKALYLGKATCAQCHELRGAGHRVGPPLDNLIHADYASTLRNIVDPNASINPDAVGYIVKLKDGTTHIGTRLAETPDELHLAQPGGAIAQLRKADIASTEAMTTSLMPTGLDKTLTKQELRDLLTYLLTESPQGK
jgi:putative heme-binding domain-containing protein